MNVLVEISNFRHFQSFTGRHLVLSFITKFKRIEHCDKRVIYFQKIENRFYFGSYIDVLVNCLGGGVAPFCGKVMEN